jgi:hypothetical protein
MKVGKQLYTATSSENLPCAEQKQQFRRNVNAIDMPSRLFTAMSTMTALPSMSPKSSDGTFELTLRSSRNVSSAFTLDFSSSLRDAKGEDIAPDVESEERFIYIESSQCKLTPQFRGSASRFSYSGYLDSGLAFELFDKRPEIEFRWGTPNRVLNGRFPGLFLVTTITWDEEQRVMFSSVTIQGLQHITDGKVSIPTPLMSDSDAEEVISVNFGETEKGPIHLIALLTSYSATDGTYLCKQIHLHES